MNPVLASIKPIVEQSTRVKINKTRLIELSKTLRMDKLKHYLEDSPFDISELTEKEKLHFMLVFDSVNFCYWGEPKWTVEYNGEKYDGAYGMIASLRRAIDNKIPVLSAEFLSKLTVAELERILEGNIAIPLFNERLIALREVGIVLMSKYEGDFANLVKEADGDAIELLNLIINNFPSFNDFSYYNNQKVFFYKRAQLLVSDIYGVFKGEGYGNLKNVDKLTAFAEYKITQVLRKFGVLEYSQELAKKIDNKIHIPKDSKEEVEIRANMVHAVELLKAELAERGYSVTADQIDCHLWLMGQEKSPSDKPYHRTRTIFY